MEGVGDMSWDNSGDVVDIDEEHPPVVHLLSSLRCPSTFTRADLSWRNLLPFPFLWSFFHRARKMPDFQDFLKRARLAFLAEGSR